MRSQSLRLNLFPQADFVGVIQQHGAGYGDGFGLISRLCRMGVIDHAMAQPHLGYQNCQNNLRIQIVYHVEIAHTESGNFNLKTAPLSASGAAAGWWGAAVAPPRILDW